MSIISDIEYLLETIIGHSILGRHKSLGGLVKQSQKNLTRTPSIPKLIKKPITSFTNNAVLNPITPISKIGNQTKRQLNVSKTRLSSNTIRSPHP